MCRTMDSKEQMIDNYEVTYFPLMTVNFSEAKELRPNCDLCGKVFIKGEHISITGGSKCYSWYCSHNCAELYVLGHRTLPEVK